MLFFFLCDNDFHVQDERPNYHCYHCPVVSVRFPLMLVVSNLSADCTGPLRQLLVNKSVSISEHGHENNRSKKLKLLQKNISLDLKVSWFDHQEGGRQLTSRPEGF